MDLDCVVSLFHSQLEEHKFPSSVEDQLMNTDFGSYFLEGDQLVNYNSPFTGYSGRQVWQTVKNTVSSCLGWLADQLIAFVCLAFLSR